MTSITINATDVSQCVFRSHFRTSVGDGFPRSGLLITSSGSMYATDEGSCELVAMLDKSLDFMPVAGRAL